MKTLQLLRHAKSDWNADYGDDHQRPLNSRGEKAAETVGRFLAAIDQVPDLVVSSSAVRARTTAEMAQEAGSWQRTLEVTRDLYASHAEAVLDHVKRLDNRHQSVLLVGHEPTWSDLAGRLIGNASLRVATATLVRIDFHVERWSALELGRGTLIWMIPPKVLQRAGV